MAGEFILERYMKEVERISKKLTEEGGWVRVRDLVRRFLEVDEYYGHDAWDIRQILTNIEMVDTYDVDEPQVVFCKDCRYCESDRAGNIGCFHQRYFGTDAAEIRPDDFCSYGRKRESPVESA